MSRAKIFALNVRRQKILREVEFVVPFFDVVCARQRCINVISAQVNDAERSGFYCEYQMNCLVKKNG